ncbi:MAG: hypothetical protein DA408_04200 [Bacteroidetes bacterium]|nr:MAG: hypothetical protein DA408_04200 [Bacteroidota bacterium]
MKINLPRNCLLVLGLVVLLFELNAQNYLLNGLPITACTGNFLDSGGNAGGYGINENFTTTICSDGSSGSHIQLLFSGINIGSGETISFYDAPTADPAFVFDNAFLITPNNPFIIQATTANSSGCLTVVFTSDDQDGGESGWGAVINCTVACQSIYANLLGSTPSVMPADTGWIDICPGEAITFNSAGSYPQNGLAYTQNDQLSNFTWEFGDGNTAQGPTTSHTYTEPGGYTAQLRIVDTFGCRNTNFLSQRIRVAPYPVFVLNNALDTLLCSGDTLRITSSTNPLNPADLLVIPDTGFFNRNNVRADTTFLPDGTGAEYESSITFTQFLPGATLTSADAIDFITLEIEHSFGGDLNLEIVCPDGTAVDLLRFPSAIASTNFGEPFATAPVDGRSNDPTPGIPYTYLFQEGAANGTLRQFATTAPFYNYTTVPSVVDGATFTNTDRYFPAGTYRPEQSFANLVGCPLNGEWKIRIRDNIGQDNGWLFAWRITFREDLYPVTETFTPAFVDWGWTTNPTVITTNQNQVVAAAQNAGIATQNFFVLDAFGCRSDTTFNFTILPPTHPDCTQCDIELNEQEDVILCENEAANFNVSPVGSLARPITFERFPQYTIGRANHPANNPYRSTLNVSNISPGILNNPLGQIVSVCVTLTTDVAADINLILEAPNGVRLTLSSGNGGNSAAGYLNTCFTPSSLLSITDPGQQPPYTGAFQPQGNWNTLIGTNITGNWTLLVSDGMNPLEFGELLTWSITFRNQNTYTYTWTPTEGLSCSECPNPVARPTTTTAYELTVTDLNGCQLQDTILALVVADIPAPMVTCQENGNAILFSWLPLTNVANYEYRITTANGTTNWLGPISDTSVLVENLINGDQTTLEVRAFFPGLEATCSLPSAMTTCMSTFCGLQVDPPTLTPTTCFDAADGALQVNISAGAPPFSVTFNGTTSNQTFFPGLAAGNYSYTVLDAQNCEFSDNITIAAPDSLYAFVNQTYRSCAGLQENEALIAGGGGAGNYTYGWSDGQTGALATNLMNGNYSITVTDGSGCQTTTTITIVGLDSIRINFIADRPSCNGLSDGGIGINQVTGGVGMNESDYTYRWDNGDTTLVRTGIPGGVIYAVTATDAQGCTGVQSRLLADPPPITFDLLATTPNCFGDANGSLTLANLNSPNGMLTNIQWDNAANNQTTVTATNLAAGAYSVTVTDANSCMANATATLGQPPTLVAAFTTRDNICFGYADGAVLVTASGGVPDYDYQWFNGAVGPNLTNLQAGTYAVTVSDSRGCEVVLLPTVTQPPSFTASAETEPTSCFGTRDGRITVTPAGGAPPYRYSIGNMNFSASNVLLGLAGGNYTLFIRDASGCQFNLAATVGEPAEFSVDAGPDLRMLYGDSIELAAVVSNAQGSVSLVWNPPYPGSLSCEVCPNPIASPDYTLDYQLLAYDENDCEASDILRVFVDKPKLAVVPTGFTPNNDGYNDLLLVHGLPGTQVLNFQVFDRWGELVYTASDFPVNQAAVGWDGSFRNQPMNGGVFVWLLVVRHLDGTEERYQGQTTLIR